MNHLLPLSHEPRLKSPTLDKLEGELNEAISQLTVKRTEHASEIAALKSPSARHLVSAEMLARAPQLKIDAVEILQSEFRIRHRIKTEYFPLLDEARRDAVCATRKAQAAAEATVKSKLISIGYTTGHFPTSGGGALAGVVESHPSVQAARNENDSAQAFLNGRPGFTENEAAMARLGEEIDEAVRLITATARF